MSRLECNGLAWVHKWVRATDIVVRGTGDGCLLLQPGLSKDARRASQAWAAAQQRQYKSMRQGLQQAACAVLPRQEGQQLPLLYPPALIFLQPLTAGSNLVGCGKEKSCCGAQAPHILVLNAAFF